MYTDSGRGRGRGGGSVGRGRVVQADAGVCVCVCVCVCIRCVWSRAHVCDPVCLTHTGCTCISVDGPDDATLIKQRNKIEKQLAEISALEKQRGSGTLDANQLAKVNRRAELQESLRQVYLQGNAAQRERLGVCGKCGVRWHTTTNCPRPKALPAPMETRGTGSSVASDASRNAHQALSSMPKSRGAGSGSGRGSGGGRGRGSGTDRARDGRSGADERHTGRSRETRSTSSASTTSQSHERHLTKTNAADVGRLEMRDTVESLVAMTGADRGVAAAALLCYQGNGNAAAAAILTGQPAPAPAASTAVGLRADDLVSSMFLFKPPPKPDIQNCDDVSKSGLSHSDQNSGKRGAAKVALDRHGLPLVGRGKGSNKDRQTVQTRPEQTLVDDFVLSKQRNKVQRQLREITELEKKRRSGLMLQPNQLAKLERQSEVEEMLRQVYLQGTREQRERLGVCGKCGRPAHCTNNCPHAVGLAAMPLSDSARDSLEKAAAAEPAEADAPNCFHYMDPVRLPLPLLL